MGVELREGFPDAGGDVCSTFFSSVDLSDKLWGSIERLAHADDVTFWTVLANHEKLPVVFLSVVTAVDHAHSSHSKAQRRAVSAESERDVIEMVMRIATATEPCARRGVDPASLAMRLSTLLPWKVLLPVSLMLLRHSGAAASVTVSSLVMLNPGYLCTLNSYMPTWWDSVNRLAVRCTHELQRGRYQRLPGDILAIFEQVYRLTKQLWAVLQCAPFLSDYLSLPRTLRSLRIVVDVLSPILQHFIIVCDELSTRRAILSRANSVIVNAALNTSSVLLLYHMYTTQGPQKHHHESFCAPQVVNATYNRLREHLQQYAQGYTQYFLQVTQNQSFVGYIHYLCPPARAGDASGDHALGQVLLSLTQEMADSNDFASAACGTRPRFFELVLLDVVRQGVHIDDLLARHFVTPAEASKLGASEDAVTRALAGLPSLEVAAASSAPHTPVPEAAGTTAASPAAAAPSPEKVDDPLVAMVMDVFPQYSPAGIRAALNFYSNDVEQLIMDASMENLPPHLVGPLTATGSSDAEVAAALAAEDERVGSGSPEAATADVSAAGSAAAAHLRANDYDDAFQPETLYRLLGRDLYELVTDSDADDAVTDATSRGVIAGNDIDDDVGYQTTLHDQRTYVSDAFDVDEDMKAKIRMLNEVMYEDELDDGQQDVHLAGGDIVDDASDGDDVNSGGGGRNRGRGRRGGGAGAAEKPDSPAPAAHAGPSPSSSPAPAPATGAAAPPQRTSHDEYHDKRYHEQRAKDRVTRTKQKQAERNERVPAYANKKKTSKSKVSGTKTSLQRAVRKGTYDPDA
ncbi:hypothetical protein ABB37_03991 [Leptomonas pyrrhocoris]|uniref:CUE domain-containing protein n=1 Tax=Leptomonas pyrrhocoris TaxID=157538 RepID=A0A0M9G3U5_LEPPY|nr:hypothetical protein ABB37_03991 [Leptomonas pyrrhocoris]KPA81683.1 hypothetical protein ABB37_03991 [Leptomonas pyrrhocoris]|eukprot:XP_015660122.1 hypothetical protein ABB37_03991 [Leptomonas pyrrhocoris]